MRERGKHRSVQRATHYGKGVAMDTADPPLPIETDRKHRFHVSADLSAHASRECKKHRAIERSRASI